MQPNPHIADRLLIANETIVAISTPPGRGGIGIIRLSGSEALSIASSLIRTKTPLAHAQARFAEVIDPDDPNTRLDEAIATFFAAPNSYTGEDIVEIAAHGSPVVLETLVRLSLARGARLAEPGEFTQRAFLSGRIDLTQAEAVRDLIDAHTIYQARVAAQQLGGALSMRIKPIKQQLVELIAILEAGVDFAEDDIDVIADGDILARIEAVDAPLQIIASSFAHGRLVHSGLNIAIVGRPNTGKSSLFNRIVNRDRAIVTAQPGTTRDLVTERVSLAGIPIELVDTAGLRDAADEAESIGVRKSREAFADADMVLLVLDATQPLNEEETAMLASLQGRKALVVLNKIDLMQAADADRQNAHSNETRSSHDSHGSETPSPETQSSDARSSRRLNFESSLFLPTIPTSALTGAGVAELQQQILTIATSNAEPQSGMLTNLRQHQAITAAIEALTAARIAIVARTPHEMLLLDLYTALRQLDALTGETTPNQILNLIFSTFCIGK